MAPMQTREGLAHMSPIPDSGSVNTQEGTLEHRGRGRSGAFMASELLDTGYQHVDPPPRGSETRLSALPPHALLFLEQRLRRAATLIGGLTVLNAAIWLVIAPELRTGRGLLEVLFLVAVGLLLDLIVFVEARNPERSRLVGLASYYYVTRAGALALYVAGVEAFLGWQPSPVSPATFTIAAFPLLVPLPARRLVVLSCAAGGLILLVLSLYGVPPSGLVQAGVYVAISVALAAFCGQVAYGLAAEVIRGHELGPYRLLELLARTRTAALWRAEHRLLARPSAVKIIRAPWLRHRRFAEHLATFQREAHAATRLTSPHSVTVYDFGVADDGSFYYVRELLEGETLQANVERDGPLSPLIVTRIALEVADALAEAHERGLVHRSLTPRQVFLCRAGTRTDFVKVIDFGLVDLEHRMTTARRASVSISGLRDVLAPEIALGYEPDKRTDIFQLGTVLYFLLTGRRWEPRSTSGEATNAGNAPILGLGRRFAGLERVVLRCLAREPEARYGSVDEIIEELGAFVRSLAADRSEWEVPVAVAPERLVRASVKPNGSPGLDQPLRPGNGARRLGRKTERRFRAREASVRRHRLERFAMLMAVVTGGSMPLLLFSPGFRSAPAHLTLLYVALVALDVSLVLITRDARVSDAAVRRLAAVYFVLRAGVMSLVSVEGVVTLGLAPARMGFSLVLIIMIPFLVTLRPSAVLVTAGLAAATHPLALWLVAGAPSSVLVMSTVNAFMALCGTHLCAVFVAEMRRAAKPRTCGPYRLVRLVARGAMGEVWCAEHEMLARPAAIKLIRSREELAKVDALSRERFAQEARVTASLTSPHTVTLYDYGVSEDGRYYYVMELLKGQNLEEFVRAKGPLPWEKAVLVGLQVCDSLAEAHDIGLVHRDLKPANLFSTWRRRDIAFVKVLDFGLAELSARLGQGAAAGAPRHGIAGTAGYLAPEILREERVDLRSDIYQVGCVLFFLMTGRLVFERGSVTALALAHVHDTPPHVALTKDRGIPPELDRVVARCLAKRPEDRFASARELARALEDVLVGQGYSSGEVVLADLLPLRARPSGPGAWSASGTL